MARNGEIALNSKNAAYKTKMARFGKNAACKQRLKMVKTQLRTQNGSKWYQRSLQDKMTQNGKNAAYKEKRLKMVKTQLKTLKWLKMEKTHPTSQMAQNGKNAAYKRQWLETEKLH